VSGQAPYMDPSSEKLGGGGQLTPRPRDSAAPANYDCEFVTADRHADDDDDESHGVNERVSDYRV